ncbi:hypothetical protein SELMODRAFT_419213 [Selaginella moellendorffii]|uniref:Uncharacterized protein n=1 Tax=Selaginella moellendorffii TaxID=88036 RepID=D8S876_SELML|nr:hypothetical protein SELMODRAFT_419213 [Selaginella moellendorffii]
MKAALVLFLVLAFATLQIAVSSSSLGRRELLSVDDGVADQDSSMVESESTMHPLEMDGDHDHEDGVYGQSKHKRSNNNNNNINININICRKKSMDHEDSKHKDKEDEKKGSFKSSSREDLLKTLQLWHINAKARSCMQYLACRHWCWPPVLQKNSSSYTFGSYDLSTESFKALVLETSAFSSVSSSLLKAYPRTFRVESNSVPTRQESASPMLIVTHTVVFADWVHLTLECGQRNTSQSDEFRNGGPLKQNLRSHAGPTALSVRKAGHAHHKTEAAAKLNVSDGIASWVNVV